jgi:DNA-3-methyladenine glycosylase II
MWTKAQNQLKKDKYISPLIGKYGSCTITPSKKEKYFEDLFESIVQQQLSITAARTILERARVGLGRVTPENILATKEIKFKKWGVSPQKTNYVKDLAEKVSREEVKEKNIRASSVIMYNFY